MLRPTTVRKKIYTQKAKDPLADSTTGNCKSDSAAAHKHKLQLPVNLPFSATIAILFSLTVATK